VDDYAAFGRLCRAVYLAARAGTVDCTAAFDLATSKLEVSPLDPDATELALLSVECAEESQPRMAEVALSLLASSTYLINDLWDLGDDRRPGEFDFGRSLPPSTLTDDLRRDVPEGRIVQAFSTIPHRVVELGREKLAPHRVSAFVCSNDAPAKAIVKSLAADLGLVGVDCGGLERARLVDAVADFLRFQIGVMGLGLFATLSLNVLVAPSERAPS